MRTSGVGRELWVLSLGLGAAGALSLSALSSCASPEATAQRGSVEAAEPQQVVQRMVPVAAHSADSPSAAASESVAAESAVARRPAEGERHAREPITSKHLEAELNRLEAELGR